MLVSNSPKRFAGYCVLLRLCAARDPPLALSSLTSSLLGFVWICFLIFIKTSSDSSSVRFPDLEETSSGSHLCYTFLLCSFQGSVLDFSVQHSLAFCFLAKTIFESMLFFFSSRKKKRNLFSRLGHPGLEPGTSPLSGVRSNHLS